MQPINLASRLLLDSLSYPNREKIAMTPSSNGIPTAWRRKNWRAPPWENVVKDVVPCCVDEPGDEKGGV